MYSLHEIWCKAHWKCHHFAPENVLGHPLMFSSSTLELLSWRQIAPYSPHACPYHLSAHSVATKNSRHSWKYTKNRLDLQADNSSQLSLLHLDWRQHSWYLISLRSYSVQEWPRYLEDDFGNTSYSNWKDFAWFCFCPFLVGNWRSGPLLYPRIFSHSFCWSAMSDLMV